MGNHMILYDNRAKMGDGTELSSDIYLPERNGKNPVILFRTPYGKNSDELLEVARGFNKAGFAFIANDVRGRGESDGRFTPYFSEANDGLALIGHFAAEKWSDGNVITWGASYSARIQWLTALKKPGHLKGMISIVSPSDPFVENPTVYHSPMNLSWLFSLRGRGMQNINSVNWEEVYNHLPLLDLPEKTGAEIPIWKEYFINSPASDFWKPLFYQGKMESLDIPVMHISGWYDDEQIGTFINYENMREQSGSAFSRNNQNLIVGPWGHAVNKDIINGHLDFGKDSKLDLVSIESKWINGILEGKNPVHRERVKIFLMGPNKWMDFEDWPIKNTSMVKLYLNSRTDARSVNGDGELQFEPPSHDAGSDQFTYDPMNPATFISGEGFAQIGGPDDYSEIETRKDILVYTTEPMKESLILAGKLKGKIFVSSSCKDTDFTMMIIDSHRDGYSQRLQDGIVRLRHREGPFKELPYTPEDLIEIEVDMWHMFHEVKKGHRLRVEISSSAFPKYARNQNIWGKQYATAEYEIANQKVFHGMKYPSRVELQVLDGYEWQNRFNKPEE